MKSRKKPASPAALKEHAAQVKAAPAAATIAKPEPIKFTPQAVRLRIGDVLDLFNSKEWVVIMVNDCRARVAILNDSITCRTQRDGAIYFDSRTTENISPNTSSHIKFRLGIEGLKQVATEQ